MQVESVEDAMRSRRRRACWILFLDLDGTVWNHLDITATTPPYRKTGRNTIMDSNGEEIVLFEGVREFLEWARERGALVVSLSWNNPSKAVAALKEISLSALFDYHAIAPHPDKGVEAAKALRRIHEEMKCRPCLILYIDDRDIHVESVKKHVPGVAFLQAWKDFKSYSELRSIVEQLLARKC